MRPPGAPPAIPHGGALPALASVTRLLVVAVLAGVQPDCCLLALLLEAPQRTFETVVMVDDDFRHARRCSSRAPPGRRAHGVQHIHARRVTQADALHPGGQDMRRPPRTCTCRCATDWPPSEPTFITSREPP